MDDALDLMFCERDCWSLPPGLKQRSTWGAGMGCGGGRHMKKKTVLKKWGATIGQQKLVQSSEARL